MQHLSLEIFKCGQKYLKEQPEDTVLLLGQNVGSDQVCAIGLMGTPVSVLGLKAANFCLV